MLWSEWFGVEQDAAEKGLKKKKWERK